MLELDGSHGEGGGQILRTALALSAATGQPFHVTRIRASRPNPGLRPQHAAVARAFAELTGGKVEGAEVGAQALAFDPGAMQGGELHVDIGTAGSVPLFLQALMPALAASRSFWRVTVAGGTDGLGAPPWDYVAKVHVNTLERIGWRPRVKLQRRGFYPRGGGGAILEAMPWEPRPFHLARSGAPFRVQGRVAASQLPDHVPQRIREAALARLREAMPSPSAPPPEVDISTTPARDPGAVVTLWADDGACILGAGALGERGKPSEEVGREAADALVRELQGPASVDDWAADQLLPYAAIAAARSGQGSSYAVHEVSGHTRTNAWVLEQFLPVRVAFEPGPPSQGVTVAVKRA